MKYSKNNNIFFADFETTTIDSSDYQNEKLTNVYLWGIVSIHDNNYINGDSLDSFMEWVQKDNRNKIIYFHNLSFDGNFISKWLFKRYPNQYKDIFNNLETNYYEIFTRGTNKIYSIVWNRDTHERGIKRKFTIKFMCSYNLIPLSINTLGKVINMNKYDDEIIELYKTPENFYNHGGKDIWKTNEKNTYIKYCNNDIEIAKQSYLNFKKTLVENNDDNFNSKYQKIDFKLENILTISTLSYKLAKNNIYNNRHIPQKVKDGLKVYSFEKYELACKFYSGGFTQFNPNTKDYEGDFTYIDINSSYPASMCLDLPYGELSEELNPKWKDYYTYIEIDMEFNIKPGFENIAYLKNKEKFLRNERYSQSGRGVYYFLNEEFQIIQKMYDIYKIHYLKKYYTPKFPFLKSFIEKYYRLKEDNAKTPLKNVYKLVLNSVYGSFCKKSNYPQLAAVSYQMYDDIKSGKLTQLEDENGNVWIAKTTHEKCYLPNKKFVSFLNTKEKRRYNNLLVGATITALSRINLINTILELGVENFLYCDTDSIFYRGKHLPKNIHDTKLGFWKVESHNVKWHCLKSKQYCYEDDSGKVKVAAAGVKKLNVNKFDEMERMLAHGVTIVDGKVCRNEDENGIILVKRDINLKNGTI